MLRQDRKVAVAKLREAIQRIAPEDRPRRGKEKLALVADVSASLLEKYLSGGKAPGREDTLARIAQAAGQPLDELFPPVRRRRQAG
jgi:transcriptional regulator with XRE-family HTH domain